MKKSLLIFMSLVMLAMTTISCAAKDDYAFIDKYLNQWGRFAQGENDLVPELNDGLERFDAELGQRLETDEKAAMGRVVFYGVVQVAHWIPLETNTGEALRKIFGRSGPRIGPSEEGVKSYFSCDVYDWWKKNRDDFDNYAPLEKWERSEYAKEVVLPMCQGVEKSRRNP